MTTVERPNSIHFELAGAASAVRLTRHLELTWKVSLHERRDVNLITANFRDDPSDLALLLRQVEAWVEQESLCAIRYELDGREYVLEAGEADWHGLPLAGCL